MYNAYLKPNIIYMPPVWYLSVGPYANCIKQLQHDQNAAMRMITGAHRMTDTDHLIAKTQLLPVACRLSPVACRLSPVACRLSPVNLTSLVSNSWRAPTGQTTLPTALSSSNQVSGQIGRISSTHSKVSGYSSALPQQ
jgi:hypothetical protein